MTSSRDVVKVIQYLSHQKRELITNVVVIIKIVLRIGQNLLLQKDCLLFWGDSYMAALYNDPEEI